MLHMRLVAGGEAVPGAAAPAVITAPAGAGANNALPSEMIGSTSFSKILVNTAGILSLVLHRLFM